LLRVAILEEQIRKLIERNAGLCVVGKSTECREVIDGIVAKLQYR
jgi:hypothetical protein